MILNLNLDTIFHGNDLFKGFNKNRPKNGAFIDTLVQIQ